jgi:hypothetical protein
MIVITAFFKFFLFWSFEFLKSVLKILKSYIRVANVPAIILQKVQARGRRIM